MQRATAWGLVLADAAALLAAFLLAHWLRFGSGWFAAPLGSIPAGQWLVLTGFSLPLWLLILALHGLYYTRLKQAFSAELGSLTHAIAEGLAATILLTFALRGLPDSRSALLLSVAFGWLLLLLVRSLRRRLRRRRPLAAVIGDGPVAEYLRRQFAGRATRFDLQAAYATVGEFLPASGSTPGAELTTLPDAIFCDAAQAGALWQRLGTGPVDCAIYFIPQDDATGGGALSVATIEGVPTLAVKSAADLAQMRSIKRVVDIAGALAALVLTSPLWLFCGLGIALTMPGPLFFSHLRIGLFGRPFRAFKFRSMVRDADRQQVELAGFDEQYKLKHDPRITPFGRLLRRTSMDELPQLLNVLRGELSLVGPRPIVAAEIEKYGHWAGLVHTVPPGLTGLWQVSGRSDTTYQQRVDFDLYYINNWSLGLDLLILARTIPAVLSRKGAY
jgi:exopolysaccharide biosynthesis polyprenyl glycosylphosphotransferase